MGRRIAILVAIVVGIAASFGAGWIVRGSRGGTPEDARTDSRRSDVVSVKLVPVPEGPAGPEFVRGKRGKKDSHAMPLRLIEKLIPDPLPVPLEQPGGCRLGENLVIGLSDSRELAYGPCVRPSSIERLRGAISGILGAPSR